tara:strand:- start:36586 stop:37365 length:780 start_codon:yes stop_codon:yes gene_type:complete
MFDFLELPSRDIKPRSKGLTVLIDNGYSTEFYQDVIISHGQLIDYIKFGWCTSYITRDFDKKIQLAKDAGIDVFLGGTFFEKAYSQKKLDNLLKVIDSYAITTIEISNGTIPISNQEKASVIQQLAGDYQVFSEVGYKECQSSEQLTAAEWIEYIKEDLNAGAVKVITEARESGKSGLCDAEGNLKTDFIDDILMSGITSEQLIFEAPNKALQHYFIALIGSNVNLANIAFQDIIPLETLRLGLRSDTLLQFDNKGENS